VLERALSTKMIRTKVLLSLATFVLSLPPVVSYGQSALPTAERPLQLSAFAGLGGAYTRLSGGRNLDLLAGADLGLPPVRHIRPELEVRGAYPIDGGRIDAQKSILAGGKAVFLLEHSLRPYADFLFGRGEIKYRGAGYQFGNEIYLLTTTNVYSFGGGFDYPVSREFALRVDGQYQKWGYAPTASGNLYPVVATAAIVYHFNFSR
jgi:hypothetical protein